MQWGCLIKKTHLHNERLVSFPCPQWAQSWQQHCLSAALGLHQHWDLFPSHKWSKGDLKHAVSARTTQGTYSKAKSSQWHLINSSLPPAGWYCLDFLGAQLPPLPKVSQHQERLLHLILRIGWRPKVFPCSVWSVWVTETSPHSWSSVLFANIPILKFHNVSWKILIIDYMQLFCLSRSFLLFFCLGIRRRSHFTIWIFTFSCNMRHAYQYYILECPHDSLLSIFVQFKYCNDCTWLRTSVGLHDQLLLLLYHPSYSCTSEYRPSGPG